MSLTSAPKDARLKIAGIEGGHGVRRRLFSLGLHKNDLIEVDSKSIFGGPIVIHILSSDTSVAVGRGIAHNIMVEVVGSD